MSNYALAFVEYINTSSIVNFNNRFYPLTLPQNPVYPCAVYQSISAIDIESMRGYSGLTIRRLQVTIFDSSYSRLMLIGNEFKHAVRYYTARKYEFNNGFILGVRIDRMSIINDIEIKEPSTNVFTRILDVEIAYAE
jgi:hypothetical protein